MQSSILSQVAAKMPRLPALLIAAFILGGCRTASKEPSLPIVKHPSASFAREMNNVCKPILTATRHWKSNDPTYAYTLTLRMKRQLSRLHPPRRERRAFEQLLVTLKQMADAYGRAALFPNNFSEIYQANLKPEIRMVHVLAYRLHARSC